MVWVALKVESFCQRLFTEMNKNSGAVEYLREKSAKEFELKEKELELIEVKQLLKEKGQRHTFKLERKEHDEK